METIWHYTHTFIYCFVQEAQRAAKAADKLVGGQKQKQISGEKEESRKCMHTKTQTSGLNVTKSDYALVSGECVITVYFKLSSKVNYKAQCNQDFFLLNSYMCHLRTRNCVHNS